MVAAVLGLFMVPTGIVSQTSDKAMAVFLTAAQVTDVTTIDKDTQKRLELAVKDTRKALKDLEKVLKAQHGSKSEKWPDEAQERHLDAQEAVAVANADWLYRRVKQEGLTDSVEDIRQALTGHGIAGVKENVKLVDALADAQLVVEVTGRRSGNSGKPGLLSAVRDDQYWIKFSITPGPNLSAERFGAVPPTYRFKHGQMGWRLGRARPEAAEWRFEGYGELRWANPAHVVSLMLEDFIAKNYDLMTQGVRNVGLRTDLSEVGSSSRPRR